jgi:NADP-dependent 3-hydroxy acid dehydrogenase YdfG
VALKAATPDQIARIGRYMKEQPAEVNRNPMIVLKILDEVDPGISG